MTKSNEVREFRDRVAHHPPKTADHAALHEQLRARVGDLGEAYITLLPNSRERSLALTALQESLMWANAAVAYGPDPLQP